MPPVASRENNALPNSPTTAPVPSTTKCITGYIPIKDAHWDYATPTAIANIKGGDYYFTIWREGAADTNIANDVMYTVFELSFKDP